MNFSLQKKVKQSLNPRSRIALRKVVTRKKNDPSLLPNYCDPAEGCSFHNIDGSNSTVS